MEISRKMSEHKQDELDEIFVDKNEPADKRLVVEILKHYVTIDLIGNISFSENFEKINNQHKALIYLISKKAMILKGIKSITEPSKIPEVSKGAFISKSDVKNALCTNYKKLVLKEKEGYVIPNHNLKKIKNLIENGN